jgi:hypothetical protein
VSAAPPRLRWFVRGALQKAAGVIRERRFPASPAWWLKALYLHYRETMHAPAAATGPEPLDQARLDESYRRWLRREPHTPAPATSTAPSTSLTVVALDPAPDIRALDAGATWLPPGTSSHVLFVAPGLTLAPAAERDCARAIATTSADWI